MNRKFLLGAVIVAVVLAAGCVQETTDGLKGKVQKRAKEVSRLDIPVENILPKQIDNGPFSKYKIYRIYRSPTATPGIALNTIAIGPDGNTFILPEKFNKLIKRENIPVNNKNIMNLAKFFVVINSENKYDTIILNRSTEIPKTYKNQTNPPSNYKDIIIPPELKKEKGNYIVSLYTWEELNGILARWEIKITSDGYIKDTKREIVGKGIGNSIGVR